MRQLEPAFLEEVCVSVHLS